MRATSFLMVMIAVLALATSVVFSIMASAALGSGNVKAGKKWSTASSIVGSLSILPLIPVAMDMYKGDK